MLINFLIYAQEKVYVETTQRNFGTSTNTGRMTAQVNTIILCLALL